MITRYASGEYTDTYKKTIGTDFMERDLELASGEQVKLMLWASDREPLQLQHGCVLLLLASAL